jgi:hypothetical protein
MLRFACTITTNISNFPFSGGRVSEEPEVEGVGFADFFGFLVLFEGGQVS